LNEWTIQDVPIPIDVYFVPQGKQEEISKEHLNKLNTSAVLEDLGQLLTITGPWQVSDVQL
jgi:hypothetical protein